MGWGIILDFFKAYDLRKQRHFLFSAAALSLGQVGLKRVAFI